MSAHIRLKHMTRYRYDRPVRLGPHVLRLKPAPHSRAALLDYRLTIVPSGATLTWHHDPFANSFARAVFDSPTQTLEVQVELELVIGPVNPFEFLIEPEAERLPFEYGEALRHDLAPFLAPAKGGMMFDVIADKWRGDGRNSVAYLVDLAGRIAERITYVTRDDPGTWAAEKTLERGHGSCRDTAWLLVEILRRNGIAARFVSGYLIELATGDPDLPKVDRGSLHAWCEAFLPGAGWIGVDCTSGLFATESHLPLVTGTFPDRTAPIEGTVEPCEARFDHDIDIERLG